MSGDCSLLWCLMCSSLSSLSRPVPCAISFTQNVLYFFIPLAPTLPSKPNTCASFWNLPCFLLGGTRIVFWAITLCRLASSHLLHWTIMMYPWMCLPAEFWAGWPGDSQALTLLITWKSVLSLFRVLSPVPLAFHVLVHQNEIKLV